MTSPISSSEPLFIEVPEQRTYTISKFVGNYITLIFLFLSIPFSTMIPLAVFLGLALFTVALTYGGLKLSMKTRVKVREKLRSELQQKANVKLPVSFDPQALPKKAYSQAVSVQDAAGAMVEWNAARNGSFFRFAPSS